MKKCVKFFKEDEDSIITNLIVDDEMNLPDEALVKLLFVKLKSIDGIFKENLISISNGEIRYYEGDIIKEALYNVIPYERMENKFKDEKPIKLF